MYELVPIMDRLYLFVLELVEKSNSTTEKYHVQLELPATEVIRSVIIKIDYFLLVLNLILALPETL